jgi:hypothetical protein
MVDIIEKKIQSNKEQDPEWIVETVKELFKKDINNLSKNQRKILRDQYLDNLREGLRPKEAMEKAILIVSCFNE